MFSKKKNFIYFNLIIDRIFAYLGFILKKNFLYKYNNYLDYYFEVFNN